MSRQSRTGVLPPDLRELGELPPDPDPGPAWPDPPLEAFVAPPEEPFSERCVIGGDPGLVEVLTELMEAAEAPGRSEATLLSTTALTERTRDLTADDHDPAVAHLTNPDTGPHTGPGPGVGQRGQRQRGLGAVDLDRLVREMWWDRDEAELALLGTNPPAWATTPAGPDLAAALDQVRLNTATPVTLIEVMKAATRMQAWAEAMTAAAMAAFWRHRQTEAATRAADDDPHYSTPAAKADPMYGAAAEIAAALRLPPRTVHGKIADAVRLTTTLTETFTALRAGQLTMTKTIALLDGTEHLSPTQQRAVQHRVLRRAPDQTRPQLNAAIRRACATIDPDGENQRHQRAKRHREITIRPLPDGMAQLTWTDAADLIQTAWITLNCLADAAKRTHTGPANTNANPDPGTKSETDADADADAGAHAGAHAGTGASPGSDAGSDYPAANSSDSADDGDSADGADDEADGGDDDADHADGGDGTGGPDRRTADQRRCDAASDLFRVLLDRGTDWLDRPSPPDTAAKPTSTY